MISGTFQISWLRSPSWRSLPLHLSVILPLAGWPISAAGCSAPQGAEWSNALPISHGRFRLREAICRSRRVRSMPTRVAVDAVERLVGRDVAAAALERDDQFDLVMHVLGQRRIGHGAAVRHDRVGGLGEKNGGSALVVAHFADVLDIVAADAPDAAHGKVLGRAGDGDGGLRRRRNDVVVGHRMRRCECVGLRKVRSREAAPGPWTAVGYQVAGIATRPSALGQATAAHRRPAALPAP